MIKNVISSFSNNPNGPDAATLALKEATKRLALNEETRRAETKSLLETSGMHIVRFRKIVETLRAGFKTRYNIK